MIRVLAGVLAASLMIGVADRAAADTIDVGAAISLSPTTFALPIDISGAIDVVSWQFDLTYDPADVQINTGCDFLSDPYCSLFTGPVTEGDFFVSGAPFNVLDPGFIALDSTTFAQTGSLFGVNGAFGGSPPAPSGSGTLAFVEFTIVGSGTSPITVSGSTTSLTEVPEPGTLALLVSGAVLPCLRRSVRRRTGR